MFREQEPSLLRLGFLLTGSRDVAEDLVQTAFEAAQKRWATIDEPAAYLRQVVVNRAKDTQRRSFRAPPLPPEGVTEIPEIDETFQVLLHLSQAQRTVVVLHYYEDLTLAEIAVVLDRPDSTVRSDLRRALHELRKTMP
jgi:RNA polymerase sigma factor (sigma-70 family)